jgi:endoglucanase
MATRLTAAGISSARGFSLNVSHFDPTATEVAYGHSISSLVGGKTFVVDTSRNGLGTNGQWCNPSGRALGDRPTAQTGDARADAFLYIKRPGESDGTCNGGPAAGTFWPSYAIGLANRAAW